MFSEPAERPVLWPVTPLGIPNVAPPVPPLPDFILGPPAIPTGLDYWQQQLHHAASLGHHQELPPDPAIRMAGPPSSPGARCAASPPPLGGGLGGPWGTAPQGFLDAAFPGLGPGQQMPMPPLPAMDVLFGAGQKGGPARSPPASPPPPPAAAPQQQQQPKANAPMSSPHLAPKAPAPQLAPKSPVPLLPAPKAPAPQAAPQPQPDNDDRRAFFHGEGKQYTFTHDKSAVHHEDVRVKLGESVRIPIEDVHFANPRVRITEANPANMAAMIKWPKDKFQEYVLEVAQVSFGSFWVWCAMGIMSNRLIYAAKRAGIVEMAGVVVEPPAHYEAGPPGHEDADLTYGASIQGIQLVP